MTYTKYVLVEYFDPDSQWLVFQITGVRKDIVYPEVIHHDVIFKSNDLHMTEAAWSMIKHWKTHKRIVETLELYE